MKSPLRLGVRTLAPVAFVLAGACTEPVAPTAAPVSPTLAPRAVAVCTADVRAKSLSCTDARVTSNFSSSIRGDVVVVGGQDLFVKLTSSGTAYDEGTQILSSNVNIQNLIKYEMGTENGSTVSGVDIFFNSDPVVTSGTGTVTVANADGVAAFTGPNNSYFHYSEILSPFAISASRSWQFNVPSTVNTFAFTLYVNAPITASSSSPLLANIWNGSSSNAWTDASNWRDGVVPDSASTATIPTDSILSSHVYPVAPSDIRVTNLRVGTGSSLDLNTFTVTVYDNVDATGSITSGTVKMPGAGALLGGNVPALVVTGAVSLQRSTRANQAVSISDGSLNVADKSLSISLQ
jgi:hypothetical protein